MSFSFQFYSINFTELIYFLLLSPQSFFWPLSFLSLIVFNFPSFFSLSHCSPWSPPPPATLYYFLLFYLSYFLLSLPFLLLPPPYTSLFFFFCLFYWPSFSFFFSSFPIYLHYLPPLSSRFPATSLFVLIPYPTILLTHSNIIPHLLFSSSISFPWHILFNLPYSFPNQLTNLSFSLSNFLLYAYCLFSVTTCPIIYRQK